MADVAYRFDSNIAAAALKASRKARFGDIFTDSQGGSEYLVAQFMTPQGMCRSCAGLVRLPCTLAWLLVTSDIQMTRAWTYGPCTPLHVPFDKEGARNMYVWLHAWWWCICVYPGCTPAAAAVAAVVHRCTAHRFTMFTAELRSVIRGLSSPFELVCSATNSVLEWSTTNWAKTVTDGSAVSGAAAAAAEGVPQMYQVATVSMTVDRLCYFRLASGACSAFLQLPKDFAAAVKIRRQARLGSCRMHPHHSRSLPTQTLGRSRSLELGIDTLKMLRQCQGAL